MAITHTETQVTWPTAANTVSVTSGSNATSETITIDATCFQASIICKADNAGTPASGDYIEIWALPSAGDPDGSSTDEHPSTTQGWYLGLLDTNGDDPATRFFQLPVPAVSYEFYVLSNAASNSITFSCSILEQRG